MSKLKHGTRIRILPRAHIIKKAHNAKGTIWDVNNKQLFARNIIVLMDKHDIFGSRFIVMDPTEIQEIVVPNYQKLWNKICLK